MLVPLTPADPPDRMAPQRGDPIAGLEKGLAVIGAEGAVLAAMNVSVHAARRSAEQLVDGCLPATRQTQATLRRPLRPLPQPGNPP